MVFCSLWGFPFFNHEFLCLKMYLWGFLRSNVKLGFLGWRGGSTFTSSFAMHMGVLPAWTINPGLNVFKTTRVVCIWASKLSMDQLVDVTSQGKYCSTPVSSKTVFYTVVSGTRLFLIDLYTEHRALWRFQLYVGLRCDTSHLGQVWAWIPSYPSPVRLWKPKLKCAQFIKCLQDTSYLCGLHFHCTFSLWPLLLPG